MPRLARATPAQILASWRLNAVEWSDGLSVAQHVAREEAQIATYPVTGDRCASREEDDTATREWQRHYVLLPDSDSDSLSDSCRDANPGGALHDGNGLLDGGTERDVILAACECLYRPALYVPARDPDERNMTKEKRREIVRVAGWAIASVFVAPHLRGRGFGKTLMTLVAAQLDRPVTPFPWPSPPPRGDDVGTDDSTVFIEETTTTTTTRKDIAVSCLWSDIGPEYYSRLGWSAHTSTQTVISLPPHPPPPRPSSEPGAATKKSADSSTPTEETTYLDAEPAEWTGTTGWVTRDSLEWVCHLDVAAMTHSLERSLRLHQDDDDRRDDKDEKRDLLTFLPTADVMRWQISRATFLNRTKSRLPEPVELGFHIAASSPRRRTLPKRTLRSDHDAESRDDDDDNGGGGLILWTTDMSGNRKRMDVLRMRAPDASTRKRLLEAAIIVAERHALERIILWDDDGDGGLGVHDDDDAPLGRGVTVVHERRESSLGALRVTRAGKVREAGSVDWINMERFCWS